MYLSAVQTCGHSLYPMDGYRNSVEVECVGLDELIARCRFDEIDVLKFDIEGAEWEIFRDFRFAVPISCLIGELHMTSSDEQAFCRLFTDRGYTVSLCKDRFVGVTMFRALRAFPGSQPASG